MSSRKLWNETQVPSLNLKKTSNGISGIILLGLKHWFKLYQRSFTQVTNPLPNKRLSLSRRNGSKGLLYLRRLENWYWQDIGKVKYQKVFREISTYALTSTMESLDLSTISSYINSARLEDGNRKHDAFILHWQDQVRKCKAHVAVADHFSVGQKEDLVAECSWQFCWGMHSKEEADQQKTQLGIDLTYLQDFLQHPIISCNNLI